MFFLLQSVVTNGGASVNVDHCRGGLPEDLYCTFLSEDLSKSISPSVGKRCDDLVDSEKPLFVKSGEKPVEVGSLSHYLQGFSTIPGGERQISAISSVGAFKRALLVPMSFTWFPVNSNRRC